MRQAVWRWMGAAVAIMALAVPAAAHAVEQRLAVGQGVIPVELSADWSAALPSIARAIVMVPDSRRDAELVLRQTEQTQAAAGVAAETTLLIVPHFLTPEDVAADGLPAATLRWSLAGWKDGSPALGPVPQSSFDVIDAILAQLADAARFPALRLVVLAGHSAGGQMVQRYAVAGHGDGALAVRHIALRYVVADPSSYAWFGTARPVPVDPASCPDFDRWKYGMREVPPYVGPTDALERRYIARDVIYLLGERDTDPNHPSLDRSCAAEAQGANRYIRGMQYLFGLELRHPNLVRHRILSVPGVGHDSARIFASTCGLAALFDRPGCPGF